MLLVLTFINLLIQPGYGVGDIIVLFVRQLGIGVLVGVLVGAVGVYALRGFLAVYLAGLLLGSATLPGERTMVSFHEGLGWLAQVAMFVTLGLLVFPTQLGPVAIKGTVLAIILVVIARPVAVLLSTLPFAYSWPERAVLCWAGLRGAVPVSWRRSR